MTRIFCVLYLILGILTVYLAYRDDSLNITGSSWPRIKYKIGNSLYFDNDRSKVMTYIGTAYAIMWLWPAVFFMVIVAAWRRRRQHKRLEPFRKALEGIEGRRIEDS